MKKKKFLILVSSLLLTTTAIVSCKNEEKNSSNSSSTPNQSMTQDSSQSTSTSGTESNVTNYYKDANGFRYLLSDDNSSYVVGYVGDRNVTSIEIPSLINGLPVTAIEDYAFKGMENLNIVSLPSKITSVGREAFKDCKALSTIKLDGKDLDVVVLNQYATSFNQIKYGVDALTNTYLPKVNFGSNNKEGNVNVTTSRVSDEFDSISYHIEMNSQSPYKADGKIELNEITGNLSKTIEVGAHGKYAMSYVEFRKGGKLVSKIDMPEFGIYNSEYNVAFLSATYPVTVFSLKANTITKNGEIPTYTFLERNRHFDWNNLQYGIRQLPNASFSDATKLGYREGSELMDQYIQDLYDVNPDSVINFYVTDLSIDMIYKFFVANRIDESQYNIIMLSDGTASASMTVKEYGVNNPEAKFDQMLTSLKKVKDHIWETGEFDLDYISKNLMEHNGGTPFASFHFANHMYTTLKLFNNCEWWVNRFRVGENLAAINEKSPEFAAQIVSDVTNNIYTNSLLAALTDEEVVKFKTLFHFDDEMFTESRTDGKKIMVMLGTSWSGEKDNLYNYMKATMDFYGDEYDYYYKPHPGWPTATCTERNEIFNKLKADGYKVTELDGSIAAEIIMFFNNDIYLCGYSSSTYASLDSTNKGMGAMEWGCAMPVEETDPDYAYKKSMYTYITVLDSSNELFTKLNLDTNKTYYLVEYNDYNDASDPTSETRDDPTIASEYAKHDSAVYCLEDGLVRYYKNGVEVNKDGTSK